MANGNSIKREGEDADDEKRESVERAEGAEKKENEGPGENHHENREEAKGGWWFEVYSISNIVLSMMIVLGLVSISIVHANTANGLE